MCRSCLWFTYGIGKWEIPEHAEMEILSACRVDVSALFARLFAQAATGNLLNLQSVLFPRLAHIFTRNSGSWK